MPAESNDARAIVDAVQELRDAILFHAAYTVHPEAFPSVKSQDENYISHSMKTAFRYFKERQI